MKQVVEAAAAYDGLDGGDAYDGDYHDGHDDACRGDASDDGDFSPGSKIRMAKAEEEPDSAFAETRPKTRTTSRTSRTTCGGGFRYGDGGDDRDDATTTTICDSSTLTAEAPIVVVAAAAVGRNDAFAVVVARVAVAFVVVAADSDPSSFAFYYPRYLSDPDTFVSWPLTSRVSL